VRYLRAVDRFLEQMQIEHDWTARTIDSVYRVLVKLADDNPELALHELSGRTGTDRVRAHIGKLYGRASAATRATRISYFRSFFAWAENEGFVDDDPARRIKRPPKRKPDTYKPSAEEIAAVLRAATRVELPALLLMSGAGLRAAEVVSVTWRDLDLTRGAVRVKRKGNDWQRVPLDPLVTDRLRTLHREIGPDPADHVFVAETEQWITSEHRVRAIIDPRTPRTPKTAWRMVGRVSKRAGVRPLGPHMLRRGFANAFLRDTRLEFGTADVWTLKLLMGHSRIDTTEDYLKDLEAEEAADVLRRLRAEPVSQSEGPDQMMVETPDFPLMEAAGIEPASAPAADSEPGGSEDDEPRPRSDRRRLSQQPPEKGGSDA
jgi:integrase